MRWSNFPLIVPILTVKDIDVAVAFYTEKLGFRHDFTLPGPDGKSSFAFLGLGNMITLGLDRALEASAAPGRIDLILYVPEDIDLDKLYAEVQARGANIVEPLANRYWGDRTFGLLDPDGFRITFARTVKQMSMEDLQAIIRGAA